MNKMHLKKKIDYDGSQLKSHWIFGETGILGDAIVSFAGRCDVNQRYMVDLIDLKGGERIYSEEMLHFIVELFRRDIEHAVLAQHLLVANIGEEISRRAPSIRLLRKGNDLFDGKAKLNVSIATVSPVSALIHVGVNISSKNTPVLTTGLKDYKISPVDFAVRVLDKFSKELKIVGKSTYKARPAS